MSLIYFAKMVKTAICNVSYNILAYFQFNSYVLKLISPWFEY